MIFLFSGHGQLVSCSVSSSDPVEELSLDIQEEARGSNPEHFVVQPAVTQLLFDHNQPSSGVLCCPEYQLLNNYIESTFYSTRYLVTLNYSCNSPRLKSGQVPSISGLNIVLKVLKITTKKKAWRIT